MVSAVVPRHASIRIAPPASLTLSEDDIARGFIEVATPVEVTVRSNVPQGYALMFELQGTQVRQAQVLGPHGTLLVDGAGGIVPRPATGIGLWHDRMELRIRFELAATAVPGRHPWPLHISGTSS